MKKLILLGLSLFILSSIYAQNTAVNEMFDKYSGKKGFTEVYISSKLLGLFADKGEKKNNDEDVVGRLKSIRILSVEDSTLNNTINFYKELSNKINMSVYEELMVVRDGSDVTKFLIRQKGDIISELLVVTGGPGGNTLISIVGDLDLKAISELSKSTGIDELKDLEGIDSKNH
jgi:hypothetical protein